MKSAKELSHILNPKEILNTTFLCKYIDKFVQSKNYKNQNLLTDHIIKTCFSYLDTIYNNMDIFTEKEFQNLFENISDNKNHIVHYIIPNINICVNDLAQYFITFKTNPKYNQLYHHGQLCLEGHSTTLMSLYIKLINKYDTYFSNKDILIKNIIFSMIIITAFYYFTYHLNSYFSTNMNADLKQLIDAFTYKLIDNGFLNFSTRFKDEFYFWIGKDFYQIFAHTLTDLEK